jgi:hypothetical protein
MIATAVAAVVGAGSPSARAENIRGRTEGAQDDIDHKIIVGVGGAADLELGNGSVHSGASLMVEWDAIEDW